eukprot:TRINITY_DN65181_c0_g1_i2.p1 TRINITY_DN65181_c0_g1~~TRINITY_DN65181_c0_g1_i2.p1  ORF type:complete len:434 (+),score=154.26 TRINITY_DN65181_c0_g1_i2:138-1439(+)
MVSLRRLSAGVGFLIATALASSLLVHLSHLPELHGAPAPTYGGTTPRGANTPTPTTPPARRPDSADANEQQSTAGAVASEDGQSSQETDAALIADGAGKPSAGVVSVPLSGDTGCRLPYMSEVIASSTTLSAQTLPYLRQYVSFAVITGSAENFFRADLALCTWLRHVPDSSLFLFADKAALSEGRRGHWVEDHLPDGVTFTKQQVEAKGYTLPWIKAQFRFLFGLDYIIREDRQAGSQKRWFLLVDDDTFVNLDGLVVKLKEFDSRRGARHGRYLSDKGWGGAGHFFDRQASETLLKGMRSACIDPYMVKSFHASDETLVRCAPAMGLKTDREATMSHCHANRIREGMLTGRHVTMHVKRDVAKPHYLAAWRMRLHYQVVYQRNLTAYKLLMKVGSCAYGGCRHGECTPQHDVTSMEIFLELSNNGTIMPAV